MGDPIEMKAIGRVFRKCRSSEEPLYVGSVKANVGHLEGASALASLIKSILILEKGIIPPNALFEKINPDIDVDFYHTEVPTKSTVWPSSGLRRISVNSFGFGGSNTHLVLDDALHYLQDRGLVGSHCTVPLPEATTLLRNGNGIARTNGAINGNGTAHSEDGPGEDHPVNGSSGTNVTLPKILVWTAADEKAVKRTVDVYQAYYHKRVAGDLAKLDRLAYTLAARRSHMLWRTFGIVTDGPENQETLSPAKPVRSSTEARLAFVFTGQGAQYADMGWDLVQYPVFANALRQIDDIYQSLGCTWSIFGELSGAERCESHIVGHD